MRLSSIVAKQIRMKHLEEGTKHTQKRNKYRNYKLKENQVPSPHQDRFYLYSNLYGNEFLFKKENFDAVEFQDPVSAYHLIKDLQQEINKQIYGLWMQSKSYSQKDYFPLNKKLVVWSTLAIWIITFILCIGLQFELLQNYIQIVQWTIIFIVCFVVFINLVAFISTNTKKYIFFQYDSEVVKLISKKLILNKQKFEKEGLQIFCDRQITWICFRLGLSESSVGLGNKRWQNQNENLSDRIQEV